MQGNMFVISSACCMKNPMLDSSWLFCILNARGFVLYN